MLPDRPIPFLTLQEMAKKGEDQRTNSDKSLSKGVVAVVSGICWQPQASFPVFHFVVHQVFDRFGAYTSYFLVGKYEAGSI